MVLQLHLVSSEHVTTLRHGQRLPLLVTLLLRLSCRLRELWLLLLLQSLPIPPLRIPPLLLLPVPLLLVLQLLLLPVLLMPLLFCRRRSSRLLI